jgi:hypothetical protein
MVITGVNNIELWYVNFFAQKLKLGAKMIEFSDGVFYLDAHRHKARFICLPFIPI